MDIILDVDGVVADLVGALLTAVGKTDRSLAKKYDWFEDYPNPEDTAKTREVMASSEFWEKLPLIPNAYSGVAYLRTRGHQIIWCTAPHEPCYSWLGARRNWLERHFNIKEHRDMLVLTEDKYLIEATCMIDDRVDLVDAWEHTHPEGIGFIYRTELNQDSGRDLYTWDDIINREFFNGRKFTSYR